MSFAAKDSGCGGVELREVGCRNSTEGLSRSRFEIKLNTKRHEKRVLNDSFQIEIMTQTATSTSALHCLRVG